MLVVEDLMHGLQRDVLVAPTIAADGVQVEQLIVVLAAGSRVQAAAGRGVGVRRLGRAGRARTGAVRDVVEEGRADADRIVGDRDRVGPITLDEATPAGHVLRQPEVRAGDELAVRVGGDHRDVVDVGVDELEAEHGRRLVLDLAPVGQAAVGRAEELAGRHRAASGVVDVLAQEDLVRGVRGVGLALVHERGVGVRGVAQAIGALNVRPARQHHEPFAGRQVVAVAEDVVRSGDQGVIGLEGHEDRAAATVGDLVQAVVEELAEDREQ